jgi:hypothetical protein
MAEAVQVAGLVTVKVGTGAQGGAETLGYTRDGVTLIDEVLTLDVPGDAYGGPDGPPIDIQYLGEICRVRMELTKYDIAVAAKLEAKLSGGTAGTESDAGTLLFAGSGTVNLVLDPAEGAGRNYARATLCKTPVEVNRGTKFSTLILEFTCYADGDGKVWD